MARSSRLLVLPVLGALTLSACGQTTSDKVPARFTGAQRDVAQTIEDLQAAGKKRDADAICKDLLAPAVVKQIETASSGTCKDVLKDALGDADAFDLQTEKVTISGATATAVVKSEAGDKDRTDTLQLQKVGGSWKIASLGAARS